MENLRNVLLSQIICIILETFLIRKFRFIYIIKILLFVNNLNLLGIIGILLISTLKI